MNKYDDADGRTERSLLCINNTSAQQIRNQSQEDLVGRHGLIAPFTLQARAPRRKGIGKIVENSQHFLNESRELRKPNTHLIQHD